MPVKFQKKRSIFLFFLSIFIVAGLYFSYDLSSPSCVDAQTCYNLFPQVRYSTTGYQTWSRDTSCVTRRSARQIGFNPPISTAVVSLTGFLVCYDRTAPPTRYCIGGDDRVKSTGARIIPGVSLYDNNGVPVVRNGTQLDFRWRTCLGDNDPSRDHYSKLWFVIYAW